VLLLLRPSVEQNYLHEIAFAIATAKQAMRELLEFPQRFSTAVELLEPLLVLILAPLPHDGLKLAVEFVLPRAVQSVKENIGGTPAGWPVILQDPPEVPLNNEFKDQAAGLARAGISVFLSSGFIGLTYMSTHLVVKRFLCHFYFALAHELS
jgi:hypothetical protein